MYLTDHHRENKYYNNDLDNSGVFIEEGNALNIADTLNGWAASSADYDNDGDLDIFVLNNGGAEYNRMYRNNIDSDYYLFIRLTDKNGSLNRFGSKAKVYFAGTDSLVGKRVVDGGGSDGEVQNQYNCHFGLDPNLAYDIEVVFTTRTNGQNHIFNNNSHPELGNYIPTHHGHFLEVRDSVVTVTYVKVQKQPLIIKTFKLYQNYPNPFNNTTIIPFSLSKKTFVNISIFDITGKVVITLLNKSMITGNHKIKWDGNNNRGKAVSSGIYLVRLIADNKSTFKKIVLIR